MFFFCKSCSLNGIHKANQMSDRCLQDQRAFHCLWFLMLKNRESIPALAESIHHNKSCNCCGPFYPTLGLGPFLFKHPFPQEVKHCHLFSMQCLMWKLACENFINTMYTGKESEPFHWLQIGMLKNREYFSLCIYSRFGQVHTSQQEL